MSVVFFTFFSSTLIGVFLLFVLGLAYQAYTLLHGFISILTLIFFTAIAAAAVVIMVLKIKECRASRKCVPAVLWNIFLSLVASAVSLYTCYLFMRDLRLYGDGVADMIFFAVGFVVCLGLWGLSTAGWLQAILTDDPASFGYKGFITELIAAFILYGLATDFFMNLLRR